MSLSLTYRYFLRNKIVREVLARGRFTMVPSMLGMAMRRWNSIGKITVTGGTPLWNYEHTAYLQPIIEALGAFRDARAVPFLSTIANERYANYYSFPKKAQI